MTYYLIAGEASGDLHGANLIKALRGQDDRATFRAWGGDRMQATGATLVKHYREMAFMGVWEVLKNLRTIRRYLKFCQADLAEHRPDVLILIDYSGFNLRVARWAYRRGLTIFYYITPQVWASRPGRVEQLRKYVHERFVILPFEPDFYASRGVPVHWFGHPILDECHPLPASSAERDALLVALLPGSRQQEIQQTLPVLLATAARFPKYQFQIVRAPAISVTFYEEILRRFANVNNVKILDSQSVEVFRRATAAVVTSGTATLEAALLDVPQVGVYRTSRLTYEVAKRVVRVPFISLVNLILNRAVVEELIQADCTEGRLTPALRRILQADVRDQQRSDYATLRQRLGPPGASERTAAKMVDLLRTNDTHRSTR